MSDNPIKLYHIHDPMCSFCWAFRPTWETVKPQLDSNIEIVTMVGGLVPDSGESMPMEMQKKLSSTWKYIEQFIPTTKFNHACQSAFKTGHLSASKTEQLNAIIFLHHHEQKVRSVRYHFQLVSSPRSVSFHIGQGYSLRLPLNYVHYEKLMLLT